MKMFVSHPDEHKREEQGNSKNGPDTAGQPKYEGLYQSVCEYDEDGTHKLGLGNPPGTDDVPQQETDKGIIEYSVRVWMMPDFRFQQQKGHPGKKNEKE
jgi:hypothetical protein